VIPFGLIEQALRLINNLLEARPPEQREADARIWFAVWWPVVKVFLPAATVAHVDKLMEEK
jgi:hypothetical protein